MVRRALGPGAWGIAVSAAAGWALGGPGMGASAALGAAVVVANFAAHGLSLSWASTISLRTLHAVALGGVALRLGAIVAVLLALRGTAWFSPLAFGLALVPGTLALLAYEARLVLRGVGRLLDVPPDPVAERAARALAAREAR